MNLVFDVDDTLYDLIIPFERACKNAFEDKIEKLSILNLYKAYRKHSEEAFVYAQNNTMSTEDMQIYRISKALLDFEQEISIEEAINFQREYAFNQSKIQLLDGIKDILDWCDANNITVGIITNGPAKHQSNKIKTLGVDNWVKNENIFISGCLDYTKPDVNIFRLVEEKMNIKPEDTYYIGDSIRNDIMGAKGAGWNMIWINCREDILPQDIKYYPDYIVKNDRELEKLLLDKYKIIINS